MEQPPRGAVSGCYARLEPAAHPPAAAAFPANTSMRRRLTALLLALAAPVAVATGCGSEGGSAGAASDVDSLLTETFKSGKAVKSGKVSVDLRANLKGSSTVSGPVGLKLTGPFQSQGDGKLPKFDFALAVSYSGQTFSAGAVSTGDKGFVKFLGKTYVASDELFASFKKSYEDAQTGAGKKKSATPTFESLGLNPRAWLDDPRKAGTEKVGGAETIHITSGVDVGAFLEDINTVLGKAGQLGVAGSGRSLSAIERSQIQRAVKSAKVDVYTGEADRILRKLSLDLELDVPRELRSYASGLSSGTISFDFLIAELNDEQTISAPTGALPLSDLLGSLGSLGLKVPDGDPKDSNERDSGSDDGPDEADSKAYLDCLNRAGSDIAKVQRCAALLKG
jgi:hypothetical protein